MTVEYAATLSSKGQVVIPADIRTRLGLVQGSVLRFIVDGDSVRRLPAAADMQRLKGWLAQPAKRVTLADMQLAIDSRRQRIGSGA
ncbi:MAG: AbrB/MazE/SpoVT family DNA-binding domain-containing protein [Rubrivivax sp.]|nr:AbrB/MazE/SpoVT family DNA-binding domain-containing protein [Rubrivivax sp.]